jgi:MFS family permease
MSTPKIDPALRRSLNNSTIAGAMGMFFFMFVQNGPIPLLLEKLGAGGIAIGLTAALFQLGMLVQIPSAFYTEKLSTRKPFFAITTILARASVALPGLFLLLTPEKETTAIWLTLGAIGFFSFMAQMSAPAWFSWMAELVPDSIRADFWSKRQGVVMIASVLSVAMIGWFLDLFPETSVAGFGYLLIFSAITGVLDILIHWFVIEPPISRPNRALSVKQRIVQPLQNRDFLFFTLAMCVWFFGFGFVAPFMNVYLKSTFDVTYTHLSAIQLAGMVSSVVSSFIGGSLINRMGLRSFGLAIIVALPLFSLIWFFLDGSATGPLPLLGQVPQPVFLLVLSSLIAGGVYAAVAMLQLNLLSSLSPNEGRTMAMAVHWTLVGILSAAGPIAGGWVKDYFTANPIDIQLYAGTAFSYWHLIVLLHIVMIWGLMLPLLMQIQKKDGEWPIDKAITDIFILTPMRSVRNVYSFNLAASAVALNTIKGTSSAAGKIAAKAAKETGTIAIRAMKETVEAASRAGKESLEKEKQKKADKKNQ